MSRFKHLEIYQQTYKLNREVFRIKQKLPKTLKYDLGEFVFRSTLRMIRGIVIANGSIDKTKILQQVAEPKAPLIILPWLIQFCIDTHCKKS